MPCVRACVRAQSAWPPTFCVCELLSHNKPHTRAQPDDAFTPG